MFFCMHPHRCIIESTVLTSAFAVCILISSSAVVYSAPFSLHDDSYVLKETVAHFGGIRQMAAVQQRYSRRRQKS